MRVRVTCKKHPWHGFVAEKIADTQFPIIGGDAVLCERKDGGRFMARPDQVEQTQEALTD